MSSLKLPDMTRPLELFILRTVIDFQFTYLYVINGLIGVEKKCLTN